MPARIPWTRSRWAVPKAASAKARRRYFLPLGRRRPISLPVSEPDIILTPSAAKRVAWIADRQSRPAILRLAVDGGGCAGFTYKFELAERQDDEDTVAETDGVKLVVDPISLDLVRGSAVDFVEDLGGASFKVTNPNAASGCGCGSSFSV
jgi:iron-sulfur cluster insertion protein